MINLKNCSSGGTGRGLFLFLFFGMFSSALVGCTGGTNDSGKRPVAQVNASVLTAEEFGSLLALRLKNYDALFAKQESNVQRIKDDILNEFITSVVMREYASKTGLPTPDAEVEEQVKKVRSSYPDDIS